MPDLLALLLVPVFAIVAPHKDELLWWKAMWKTPRHPMATRARPAGSCVPVAGHPLLRKAGLYGCIKPLRLGVMVMVATSSEHGLTSESLWNNSSDLLDVELLEWPTPPCTVGDSERLGPRMRDQGAQGWMDSKAKSTWWCAQRGHLLGVQRLVKAVPDADFYLLADADTQGPPHTPATPRARARVRTLPRLPPVRARARARARARPRPPPHPRPYPCPRHYPRPRARARPYPRPLACPRARQALTSGACMISEPYSLPAP